jgi:hypothetical protein
MTLTYMQLRQRSAATIATLLGDAIGITKAAATEPDLSNGTEALDYGKFVIRVISEAEVVVPGCRAAEHASGMKQLRHHVKLLEALYAPQNGSAP